MEDKITFADIRVKHNLVLASIAEEMGINLYEIIKFYETNEGTAWLIGSVLLAISRLTRTNYNFNQVYHVLLHEPIPDHPTLAQLLEAYHLAPSSVSNERGIQVLAAYSRVYPGFILDLLRQEPTPPSIVDAIFKGLHTITGVHYTVEDVAGIVLRG